MRKTALITGASGGLGLDFAKIFAQDKFDLVLVARTEKKLQEIARLLIEEFGIHVEVIQADLGKTDSALSVFQELKTRNIHIDILVNNAGIGLLGEFGQSTWVEDHNLLQLNMISLVQLTKLLLPEMIKKKNGKILNIASTAAFQPGPLMAIYYASKAFVVSFSEALAIELQGTGVTVTTLCPGPTITGFEKAAKIQNSDFFSSSFFMKSLPVAQTGYRALMSGQHLTIAGLSNKLGVFFIQFLPVRVRAQIAYKINSYLGVK